MARGPGCRGRPLDLHLRARKLATVANSSVPVRDTHDRCTHAVSCAAHVFPGLVSDFCSPHSRSQVVWYRPRLPRFSCYVRRDMRR